MGNMIVYMVLLLLVAVSGASVLTAGEDKIYTKVSSTTNQDMKLVGSDGSITNVLFGIPKTLIQSANSPINLSETTLDTTSASFIANIINYSNFSINEIEYYVYYGRVAEDSLDSIEPTVHYTMGGYQDRTSETQGTETVAFFRIGSAHQCFIYWRVNQQVGKHFWNFRPANAMALGCFPLNDKSTGEQILAYLKSPTAKTNLPLDYHVYASKLRIVRYCGDDSLPICLSGQMNSDHHNTGGINVYPKDVSDIAANFIPYVSQEELDTKVASQLYTADDTAASEVVAKEEASAIAQHSIEKRNVAVVGAAADIVEKLFGIPSTLIKTVSDAIDLDEKIKKIFFATFTADITNYSNFSINDIEYYVYYGRVVEDSLDSIQPTMCFTMGGYQDRYSQTQGTEVVAFFRIATTHQCFIYWRVNEQAGVFHWSFRPANAMALGCFPLNDTSKEAQILAYLKSPTDKTDLPLDYHVYASNLRIVRYCGDDSLPICISGRMNSAHHNTGRINVYPKDVANVPEDFIKYITQSELDAKATAPINKTGGAKNSQTKPRVEFVSLAFVLCTSLVLMIP